MREWMQPRRIGALVVLATTLALLPALHAHLPGVATADGVAITASHAGGAASHAGLRCQLCQVGRQTRFVTVAGGIAAPAAPAPPSLRLPPRTQPGPPGAPLRLCAPPRAPPLLSS